MPVTVFYLRLGTSNLEKGVYFEIVKTNQIESQEIKKRLFVLVVLKEYKVRDSVEKFYHIPFPVKPSQIDIGR